ncbi:MAG: NADH-quinone oxidoreductase subunit M, partial [Acidimicrobiia bacterium]|nr:NADH-quinone oxidoreductase subunit M [Acidimicrobiia bacterium]NNL28072.1 NADH-quinone oxidoreductase subunit M [Acidimicrobiia bacterium]
MFPTLSVMIWLPVLGAAIVATIPRRRSEIALPIGLGFSALVLALAGNVVWTFAKGDAGFQFAERASIYEAWGITYHL